MHVHVSRAPLTYLQIGKILVFVNHPGNKKFIEHIAGRPEEKYCKLHHKKFVDSLHPEQGDYDERRRVAVNLQNENTIEFRIFRGTVNPRHIIRNIEFVDAIVSFANPAERPMSDMTKVPSFTRYVAARAKEWPLAYSWLVFHKYIKDSATAFGPKDTRGSKKPEVEEAVHAGAKAPVKVDEGVF